jgi:hypothetical protein
MRHSALYKLPDPEFVFGHEAPRELTCGWLASNPVQVTLSGDELGAGDLDGLLHRQGVPADMILGRTGLTNMHRGDCGRTFHALSRDRTRLQPTLSSSGPRVDRLSVRDVGRPDRGESTMSAQCRLSPYIGSIVALRRTDVEGQMRALDCNAANDAVSTTALMFDAVDAPFGTSWSS